MKPLEYENHTKSLIEAFEEWNKVFKLIENDQDLENLRIIVPFMRSYFQCQKVSKRRYTPLHFAVLNGNIEVIKFMHSMQIEFSILDRHKRNLFHIACVSERNQIEVIKLLLEFSGIRVSPISKLSSMK